MLDQRSLPAGDRVLPPGRLSAGCVSYPGCLDAVLGRDLAGLL